MLTRRRRLEAWRDCRVRVCRCSSCCRLVGELLKTWLRVVLRVLGMLCVEDLSCVGKDVCKKAKALWYGMFVER